MGGVGRRETNAGLVRARFELSLLPEHAGSPSPVLVLRILELLEPVRRRITNAEQRMPLPQAGSLLYKIDPFSGQPKLWTYALDRWADGDTFKRFVATCEGP
ncbi:hypothetical protein NLJ89_g4615 [Agrocybe chaxingu]|uniref:Uncharacterized protein n=1 Tax=Agrocybe chaxingu TaxID=84603 RepID=A0A9W8MWC8_9AGAR|nr:hypothetical protein NLJ89_g4615 [Agrocybe chaxingu]